MSALRIEIESWLSVVRADRGEHAAMYDDEGNEYLDVEWHGDRIEEASRLLERILAGERP